MSVLYRALWSDESQKDPGGFIDKAYPDLTVSLSKAACTVGEKLLPLLSVSGVKEDEHKCVNCGNCKNQCPSGNVEIRKKLY